MNNDQDFVEELGRRRFDAEMDVIKAVIEQAYFLIDDRRDWQAARDLLSHYAEGALEEAINIAEWMIEVTRDDATTDSTAAA